jgi:hypothetical protein
VYKCNKFDHPISKPVYKSRTPQIRDNMNEQLEILKKDTFECFLFNSINIILRRVVTYVERKEYFVLPATKRIPVTS